MSKFNIKEDLKFRTYSQTLEILAISGPSAPWVMEQLVNKNYKNITERFGIFVNEKISKEIVKKYSKMILG